MTSVVMLAQTRRLVTSGEARRLRVAAAVSLREMANAVGVSPSTILRWERAERSPRGEAAVRYGTLLDQLRSSGAS